MPVPLQFGKQIEETSFADGQPTTVKRSIEESIAVDGVLGALNEIGASLKDIPTTSNHKMTFEVVADHKTLAPVRIVRRYETERSAA